MKPLSEDKHRSDPGCQGRVIMAPEMEAEQISPVGQMGDSLISHFTSPSGRY